MIATDQTKTTPALPADELIEVFGSGLRGRLVRPGDDTYESARAIWNAMIDRQPEFIARCAGVADVIDAVNFAREHLLPVAIRGGGHNVAGTALCDGGVVIDLTLMKGIRVDPAAKTVRAEGGVTWGDLDRETQAFGLATTGGVIPATGIGGLTLGGGLGWTMRKFGLSCDNLLSADMVTADGKLITASATENPDLFWGLRGGGGNFGVVTSLEFQLHEVGPTVLAGPVFHPMAAAGDLLRFYREITRDLSDDLLCHAGLLTSPDGVALAAMIPAYFGPLANGESATQAIRGFGTPAADMVGEMPYRTLQTIFNAAFPDGRRNYWKSAFMSSLDDRAIDVMVDAYHDVPSPSATIFLEQCGGAVSRVPTDATAFPHRNAAFNLLVLSGWDDPADDPMNVQWVRDTWERLRPYLDDGVYVNYLGERGHEGEGRVRSAFGPNYDRLVALKDQYDPSNLFRHNQNISPSG